MTSLYWARFGFLLLMALVICVLIFAHVYTSRSR